MSFWSSICILCMFMAMPWRLMHNSDLPDVCMPHDLYMRKACPAQSC